MNQFKSLFLFLDSNVSFWKAFPTCMRRTFERTRITIVSMPFDNIDSFINWYWRTLELLSQTDADIYFILGKPFPFNSEVLENLKAKFKNIDIQPYDVYDKTDYIDRLLQNA